MSTKQFIVTLKDGVGPEQEKNFIDVMRNRVDIESVAPIIEFGTPMAEGAISIYRRNAEMMVESGGAVRQFGLQMQELLKEIDRARQGELVASKMLGKR